MLVMALLAALPLGIPADSPECKSPPSRASDSYWSYVEACGCSRLDPPSKASPDYDRFLKACSEWRERNPGVRMVRPAPSECKSPPSRASDSYWDYVEACGCSRLDPPSKASPDYDRFLKACSEWRERNPEIGVIEAPPSDAASPAPSPSPPAGPDDPR